MHQSYTPENHELAACLIFGVAQLRGNSAYKGLGLHRCEAAMHTKAWGCTGARQLCIQRPGVLTLNPTLEPAQVRGSDAYKATGRCFSVAAGRVSFTFALKGAPCPASCLLSAAWLACISLMNSFALPVIPESKPTACIFYQLARCVAERWDNSSYQALGIQYDSDEVQAVELVVRKFYPTLCLPPCARRPRAQHRHGVLLIPLRHEPAGGHAASREVLPGAADGGPADPGPGHNRHAGGRQHARA